MLEYLNLILGGGALVTAIVTLAIFLIKRHDERSDKDDGVVEELKGINKRLDKAEKDNIRTQLLLLMNTYVEGDQAELLTCAEHYFCKLKGDWYLTSLFQKHCVKYGIPLPHWFNEKE